MDNIASYYHNSAKSGAVFHLTSTTLTSTNDRFEDNHAFEGSILYAATGTTVNAYNLTATSNKAYQSGGLYFSSNTDFSISSSAFKSNTAVYEASAILGISFGMSSITDTNFTENSAQLNIVTAI